MSVAAGAPAEGLPDQHTYGVTNLDRGTAARIIAALERIAERDDPRSTGKPLSRTLADYWRYRIGDYGDLAEIHDAHLTIVAIDAVQDLPHR